MVWSVVLLALIIFLFGLIFTDIASEYLARERPATASFEELAELDKLAGFLAERFGGLEISMHTLYGSITGGFTWIAAVTYFNRISMIYGLLFEALHCVLHVCGSERYDGSVLSVGHGKCREGS